MKTYIKALAFVSLLLTAFVPYSVRQTSITVYQNTFETQGEIDTLYLPTDSLQGTWTWDGSHGLVGNKSFRMDTNPNFQPFYFYLFSSQPYTSSPVKSEITAALKTNISSFGMGWQVIHNNQLAIMFVRLNFATGYIELLQTTSPHIWQNVAAIPFNVRRDNVLQPFKMWLKIDPDTMTYIECGYHAFCVENGVNKWTYPLTTQAVPTTNGAGDALIIKINPMGAAGISATAWLDEIVMSEE